MMDRIGSVEEKAFAAEKVLFQDVLGIGLARPDLERVGAERDEQPVPPWTAFRNGRTRGNEMPGCVHVHLRKGFHGPVAI